MNNSMDNSFDSQRDLSLNGKKLFSMSDDEDDRVFKG